MFYKEKYFITNLIILIKRCNEMVLKVYKKDFKVDFKSDNTPLTLADKISNDCICSYLEKLNQKLIQEGSIKKNDVCIISEESKNLEYKKRKEKKWSWLIDPIDGTKEFVKKNGQFTINIGLAENGIPVFGIVSIPVKNEIFYGAKDLGSFKLFNNEKTTLLINKNKNFQDENIKVVASSSHMNEDTKKYMENFKNPEIVNVGSSIKLLWIAENKAHIYPRLAYTSEWDTCASHAIVKYAGGNVIDYKTMEELQYNKEDLLNPFFIVF
jgi:3'(2'), 5'-bisphosphate nucleotidase